jgi:hypothetical protein
MGSNLRDLLAVGAKVSEDFAVANIRTDWQTIEILDDDYGPAVSIGCIPDEDTVFRVQGLVGPDRPAPLARSPGPGKRTDPKR